MSDIFISHAQEDSELVAEIVKMLNKEGYKDVWDYSSSARTGTSYITQIIGELEKCKIFLLIISESSTKSVHVERELLQAYETNKPIVALLRNINFDELKREWKFQIGPSVVTNIPDIPDQKLINDLSTALTDKGLLPDLYAEKPIPSEIFVRLIIRPDSLVDQLKKLLKTEKIECGYRLITGKEESELYETPLIRFATSLMVNILSVPRDALLRLEIRSKNKVWVSDYETLEYLPIHMEEERSFGA